jgi:hypothetical protein
VRPARHRRQRTACATWAKEREQHYAKLGLPLPGEPDEVKALKELIESRLPRTELADVLIDMDHRTDFLRHFLHYGAGESRLPAAERRRNSLAALIGVWQRFGTKWAIWWFEASGAFQAAANRGSANSQSPCDLAIPQFSIAGWNRWRRPSARRSVAWDSLNILLSAP